MMTFCRDWTSRRMSRPSRIKNLEAYCMSLRSLGSKRSTGAKGSDKMDQTILSQSSANWASRECGISGDAERGTSPPWRLAEQVDKCVGELEETRDGGC